MRNEQASRDTAPSGSIRFNTDSSKLEIYNGDKWWEIESYTGSGRGIWMGGSPNLDRIDYISIDSGGTAIDAANLSEGRFTGCAVSSQTRACYCGGENAPGAAKKTIDYVTISSLGDAKVFGELSSVRIYTLAALNNKIRGIAGGGGTPTQVNTLDYITFSTLGNGADFGDLSVARSYPFGCSNTDRGIG